MATHNFLNATATYGLDNLVGVGEAGIQVEFSEDHTSKHMGAGGEGEFVDMNDTSGTITVTLLPSSLSNDVLSIAVNGRLEKAFTVTDQNTTFVTQACKVMKPSNYDTQKEAQDNVWTFTFLQGILDRKGYE